MRRFLVLLAVAAVSAFTASGTQAKASAPPTLTVRSSSYGKILFDGRGFVLYAFTRDPRGGKSRCYGSCASAWPVYYKKGALVAGKGVRQKLIGTVKRKDGRRQITYNGRPLYYYVGDRSAGQVSCQDVTEFGGTWLVVRASGKLVR
jgi:predicted lipoprotein with Yx(FWY)xxD motif